MTISKIISVAEILDPFSENDRERGAIGLCFYSPKFPFWHVNWLFETYIFLLNGEEKMAPVHEKSSVKRFF